MTRFIDRSGERFGKLLVLRRTENHKGRTAFECLCDCGRTCIVTSHELQSGDTTSCGCVHKEIVREIGKKQRKHGLKGTRIYSIRAHMIERCENPNNQNYKHYGARGICVCAEWRESAVAFYEWAVQNGYSDDLTIERKDVNGNYCPENCTWIPAEEQARNQTTSVKYKGKCRYEWERYFNKSHGCLYQYEKYHNCSLGEAVKHYAELAGVAI